MEINRTLYDVLLKRLARTQIFIEIIVGPRQVGKSTAIKQIIGNNPDSSIYVNLDNPGNAGLETITFHWHRARDDKKINLLVFDEIQNVLNWPSLVKFLFDEDRDKKKFNVVLLGSAALELTLTGEESLLGRYELIRTCHWNFRESNQLKSTPLTRYLQYGGYPTILEILDKGEDTDLERCQTFIRDSVLEPVITRDILSLKNAINAGLLRQTLQLALSLPCEEVSFSKLLGQLQDKGNTSTIKGYLELLEKAFLIKLLYRYTQGQITLRTTSPKIVPLAPALTHAYTSAKRIETDPYWFGKIFEMAIINKFHEYGYELFYWSEKKVDVDLVARKNDLVIALEIKSGYTPDWTGLNAFKKKYPESKVFFVDRDLGEKLIKGDDPIESL